MSAPVRAQDGAPAKADEGLQTVTVTAQKRAQPLQKVPVAVNTVNAAAIENQNVVDFSDITRVAPAMTINQNPGNSTIALRGIGTFAFSIGIESAVSVIVDDVPIIQQLQAFSNLSDLERIEVLRGPLGTLFGKNSSAGVINVVTRESSNELTGSAQLTVTSDDEVRADASLSGPLSETTGFRLNTFKVRRKGEIHNLSNGDDLNGENAKGLRARIDFAPTAALKGKLIADYSTRVVDGPVMTLRAAPPGARIFGQLLDPAVVGLRPGPENREIRMDTPGFTDSKTLSLSGTVHYNLGSHTLTSATTHQDWKYNYLADWDSTDIPILARVSNGAVAGGIPMFGPYRSKMTTQELRIASNGEHVFNYLGGLYFSDSDSDRSFTRSRAGLPVGSRWDATTGNRTVAAFAQGDYHLSERTRVTAGARVNRETIHVKFTNGIPAVPVTYQGESSDTALTGKLALQHDFAREVMGYASVATGYKGAGYDVSSGFDQSRINRPVAPETSRAYELGVKSRFLNNRVQLNATLFRTDYEDFQAQSSVLNPQTNLLQNSVNNVGKLRTQGLELELTAKPTRSLLLDASASLVDAEILEFPNAGCFLGQTRAQGCVPLGNGNVQNLAGKRLPNAPRVKFNTGATYSFALPDARYTGTANLNYQHQSKVNFDLRGNPLQVQDGYGILNGSVALSSPSLDWKLTFFVNNLLDKSYATFVGDTADQYGGAHVLSQFLPRNSERYMGVKLRYQF